MNCFNSGKTHGGPTSKFVGLNKDYVQNIILIFYKN